MRRPTILFINRVYPPVRGATGRVLRDLARSFAREGWHVTVVTSGPKAAKERDGSINVIRVKGPERPRNFLVYGWIWMKLFYVAATLPARHLLVTMTDPPLLVLAGNFIARIKKSRHIHWCQDLYPDILPALGLHLPGFMMLPMKALARRAFRKCDKVIVIGRCMAKHLTLNRIDPKTITVIPNWPDFELVNGHAPAPVNGNNGYQADALMARPYEDLVKHGPKFRVLYAGNIGMAHPIETILNAAEILQEQNPEIEFVFVGDGRNFDDLAKERSRRGLDNVRMLPYQPASRLREMMESGDVHLISMNQEAAGCLVPSKMYAALAVQRPCILVGPEQSETAKVIKDFHAGRIVPQGQPEELAQTIRLLRMDSQQWFDAQNGAASAGEIFVPEESINAWMERAWTVVEQDLAQENRGAAKA